MALNLGGTSGMQAAAQANPWAALAGSATQLGAAALNDKTNQTYDGQLSQWFTFGDKNINVGGGSIGTSRTEPLAAVAGSAVSLLQNPLVLIVVGLVAYKALKS
jgi:hypothetical protein